MSFFDNLDLDSEIKSSGDRSGWSPLESNIYDCSIEYAYCSVSKNGAKCITFKFDLDGQTVTQDIYITSNKEKGCKNYYIDKNGNKYYSIGYQLVQDICQVALGKNLTDLSEPEDKQLMIWSYEDGKEMPQKKPVLLELIGATFSAGMLNVVEDKYSNPSESRKFNKLDKVFQTKTMLTATELAAEETEGVWYESWLSKNKGRLVDDRKESKEGVSSNPFAETDDTDISAAAIEEDSPFA